MSVRTGRVRRAATSLPAEPKARAEPAVEVHVTLPELRVRGSRSLNACIRRSIDDPQPYVVFDRTAIERAGAINLNDFLLKRLSSNTYATTTSQSGNILGDKSAINLRGLGENQTLILVDGRRLSSLSAGFSPGQPNLNGIPLADRKSTRLLPTTASADR